MNGNANDTTKAMMRPWHLFAGRRIVAKLKDLHYLDIIQSSENVESLASLIAQVIADEHAATFV